MADEIDLLLKAVEASPDNWAVRRSLAGKMKDAGRATDAGKLIQEAPEIPSAEKDQLFAAEMIAETDRPAAHALLEKFLEENGASGPGHLLQGRLHKADGDLAKAESHLKVAAVLDPSVSLEDELAGGEEPEPEVVKQEAPAEPEPEPVVVAAEPEPVAVAEPEPVEVVAEPEPEPKSVVVPPPVPLSPKPLAPPGVDREQEEEPVAEAAADEAEAPAEAVAVADETAGDEAVAVEADPDFEGTEHYDEETGERVFIVGEGELVHAHEKDPDTKEKVSALTMAIIAHAVVLVILGLVVIAQPRPNPPQITASAVAYTENDSVETMTVKKKQRTATAVTSAQPIVSVDSFSAVAMPEVMDFSENLTMVSLSNDTGFSMSMDTMSDVSNMSAIPAGMQSRCSMSQRMKRLRESGGEDRAEKSVRKALEWLAKQRNENGSFGKEHPVAMTGLTLLAFLGHCETPESPKFGQAVVGGALYLMETARKQDGFMHSNAGRGRAYEHGIATYALGELHAMTKESGKPIPRLESILKKAVGVIVDGQTEVGGWDYGYKLSNSSDMSVSGWQVQALKAAHNSGERFSGLERSLDQAMEYMKDIQDDQGAFKYRPDNPKGKKSLTGAALLGFQIWNEMESTEYEKGMKYLAKAYQNPAPNAGGGHGFYDSYYTTQAFFLHGGKEWEDYNSKFQSKLLDSQNADGSWGNPKAGGYQQVMNTAWGALMLEVYYRYLPMTEKVKGLKSR